MSISEITGLHPRAAVRRTTPVRRVLRRGRGIAEYRPSHSAAEPDNRSCLLTAKDYYLLADYAERYHDTPQFESQLLRMKLSTACIVGEESVPDVVTLDSRVVFRINGGALQTRILSRRSRELDTITPLALAMLGHRVGDTVYFQGRDGSSCTVMIDEVPY
jgi:regulator of nucleoside diphosphate kinase